MRVALYARVSTDRQERERTIESQIEVLEAKAASEKWKVEMVCLDEGYSGAYLDRPGLDRVRDASVAGRIDAVVVLCADRLARNYVHQMIVLEELNRFGVKVVFCEGGAADDPHGRLLVQIQAAVAEFERTKIAERNRRGKLFRARQGAIVSGQVPYGYRKLPASDGLPPRLEIFEPEAEVVRRIFHLHVVEQLSVRMIAIRLTESEIPSPRGSRVWSTSTLDRMLRQEAYAGTFYYNRRSYLPKGEPRRPRHSAGHRPITQPRPRSEWIGAAVPPIVDLETWTHSQSLHRMNSRFSPRHVGAEKYLLRYLVRCGECEQARAAAGRTRNGREDRWYRCDAVLPMHLRAEKLRCSQPSSRADELDALVWEEVERHLCNPHLIVQACCSAEPSSAPNDAGLVAMQRQLSELRAQVRRLVDAYQAGAIPLDALNTRQHHLAERIAELELVVQSTSGDALNRKQMKSQITQFAEQVADNLDRMNFVQRQELLRTILEKVVVTEEKVELFFKIPLPPSGPESNGSSDGKGGGGSGGKPGPKSPKGSAKRPGMDSIEGSGRLRSQAL